MTMVDRAQNQAVDLQPSRQKPGLGFPICRMVALICLCSGALLNALEADDILLGDAFYPTYFLLCKLVQRGVDGCSNSTVYANAAPISRPGRSSDRAIIWWCWRNGRNDRIG
nr:hypothetical protein [Thiocapsa imhoffii]